MKSTFFLAVIITSLMGSALAAPQNLEARQESTNDASLSQDLPVLELSFQARFIRILC